MILFAWAFETGMWFRRYWPSWFNGIITAPSIVTDEELDHHGIETSSSSLDPNQVQDFIDQQILNRGTSSTLLNHVPRRHSNTGPTQHFDFSLPQLTGDPDSYIISEVINPCPQCGNGCMWLNSGDSNASAYEEHIRWCRFINEFNIVIINIATARLMASHIFRMLCQPDTDNHLHYFYGQYSAFPLHANLYIPDGYTYSGLDRGRNYLYQTHVLPVQHELAYTVYNQLNQNQQLKGAFLEKLAQTLLARHTACQDGGY